MGRLLAGAGERVTTGRQLNPKNYGIPNATVVKNSNNL